MNAAVGTVVQDQRGMQWTCRLVHQPRGPLYVPTHIAVDIPAWAMSTEDELYERGIILAPLDQAVAA